MLVCRLFDRSVKISKKAGNNTKCSQGRTEDFRIGDALTIVFSATPKFLTPDFALRCGGKEI